MTFQLTHRLNDRIQVFYQNTHLFDYVYEPKVIDWESPRPYFHPLRSLDGDLLTNYRPTDHLWHKGLSMTLTVVNDQNFWGGNTYVHDEGYIVLDNVGKTIHEKWQDVSCDGSGFSFAHDLTWITSRGEEWISEFRSITSGTADIERGIWSLNFQTKLTNISNTILEIGSPTTEGRENAGYGGLFWRGPRDFLNGKIIGPEGEQGEEMMGSSATWLAYVGQHDGSGRYSTFVFRDQPDNLRYPNKWFVRSQPFACASFAFMFDEVYEFQPAETLSLAYEVVIANGRLEDPSQIENL